MEQEQHLNKRQSPFNKMLVSLILHRWDKCSPWVWLSLHLLLLWVLTNRWVKCNPRWCSSPWCNNLNQTRWCNLCRWACNNRSTTNKHTCSLKRCSNLCKCNHRWWVNPKWCNLCSNTCNSKFNTNNSLWVNPKWCNLNLMVRHLQWWASSLKWDNLRWWVKWTSGANSKFNKICSISSLLWVNHLLLSSNTNKTLNPCEELLFC